jgi:hypothetical protein
MIPGKRRMQLKAYAATEMRTQQECILNGGVYLLHRLRKADFLEGYVSLLSHTYLLYLNSAWRARWAYRSAGVQETANISTSIDKTVPIGIQLIKQHLE